MDIKKFAVSPTSRLHFQDSKDELMYADGDTSKPMAANVYGPGSKQYARAQAAQQNRIIDKLKKKGKTDETEAEKREQQAEFLAACTESFENVGYGEPSLEGAALFRAVYADVEIGFIAEQVGKYLGDWGNFTKVSTKT